MAAPNPDSLKSVKDVSRPMAVFSLARTPGNGDTYFGSADFKVSAGNLGAAKVEFRDLYSHGSYVTGVALAGKWLVSGGYDGKLVWWDTVARKQVRTVDAHAKWIRKVIATPDGKQVISVADDMVCRVWDAESGKKIRELKGHAERTPNHYPSMLYAVAVSRDGKLLATGDKIGHVVIWDLASGQSLTTLEAPVMYTWDPVQRLHSIGGIRSLAFSPDGKQLAVGGMGKVGNIDHLEGKSRVEVFDWKAGKQLAELSSDKHKGLVNTLIYAPDASWLLAAGGANEGFLIFYDVAKKKALREEKVNTHIHDAWLSPTGNEITYVGHNKIAIYSMT